MPFLKPALAIAPLLLASLGAAWESSGAPFAARAQVTMGSMTSQGAVQTTEAEITFDFGSAPNAWTLLDYVHACGDASPLLFRFDPETGAALQGTSIRLMGTKSLGWDELRDFTRTMLLLGDFNLEQLGNDEAPVLEITRLTAQRSQAGSKRPSTVTVTPDGYEAHFPPGPQQWSLSLLDVLGDVSRATGTQMTWASETEDLLQSAKSSLVGRRPITGEGLVPFLSSLVSVANCTCEVIGDGDVSVLLIKPQ